MGPFPAGASASESAGTEAAAGGEGVIGGVYPLASGYQGSSSYAGSRGCMAAGGGHDAVAASSRGIRPSNAAPPIGVYGAPSAEGSVSPGAAAVPGPTGAVGAPCLVGPSLPPSSPENTYANGGGAPLSSLLMQLQQLVGGNGATAVTGPSSGGLTSGSKRGGTAGLSRQGCRPPAGPGSGGGGAQGARGGAYGENSQANHQPGMGRGPHHQQAGSWGGGGGGNGGQQHRGGSNNSGSSSLPNSSSPLPSGPGRPPPRPPAQNTERMSLPERPSGPHPRWRGGGPSGFNGNNSSQAGGGGASGSSHQKLYKTKICPWYPLKRCTHGDQCSWAHSGHELRNPPQGSVRSSGGTWGRQNHMGSNSSNGSGGGGGGGGNQEPSGIRRSPNSNLVSTSNTNSSNSNHSRQQEGLYYQTDSEVENTDVGGGGSQKVEFSGADGSGGSLKERPTGYLGPPPPNNRGTQRQGGGAGGRGPRGESAGSSGRGEGLIGTATRTGLSQTGGERSQTGNNVWNSRGGDNNGGGGGGVVSGGGGQRAHHQQHHRGKHNGGSGFTNSHHGQGLRASSQESRSQLSDAGAVGNTPLGANSRNGTSQAMQSGVERPSLQHLRAPGSGEGTSPSAGSASQVRPRGNGGSISSGGGAPGNSLPGETTAGETTSRASPAHGGVGGGSVNTSCNQVGGASFVLGPGKRRLCPYLTRKNGCYKGQACRYAHSEEEALSAALMQQAGIRNSSVGSPAVASAPSCVGTPTSGKSTVSASHPGLGIDPMASSVSTPLGGPGVGGPVALMLDPASTAGLLLLHSQPGDIPSSTLGPREDGVGLSPAALPIPLPVRQVAGVANTETLHKGQLARCVCTTGSEKLFANALKADGGTAGGDASSGVVSDGVPRVVTLGQQNAVAAHHHHSAAVQLGHHGLSPTAAAALAPGALHFQQGAVPALVMNSPGAVMPAPMGGPTPALKGGGDFQTGVSVEDAAAADATGHNSRQPSGVAAGRPVGSETPVPVAAAEIPSAAGGGVSAASGGMVGTGVMTGVQPLAAVRLPSGQTPPTAAVAPPPYWPPGIQASPPQQQGVVVGPPHPHPQAAGALLAPGVGGPAVGTLIAPGAAAAGAHHHHHHPGAVAPGCLPTAFGLIAPPPPAIAGGGGQQQPAHHALMLGGHQGTALPATALLPSGAHPGFYFAGAPRAGSNTVMSIMPIPLMHFAASTEELNAAAPLFYED